MNDTTGLAAAVSPCQQVRNQAAIKVANIYAVKEQQLLANFLAAYMAKCVDTTETFTVVDTVKEYHYTLYYYDQAGNLIKTVPPKGVNPIYRTSFIDSVENFKRIDAALIPKHTYVTRYTYNALNQVSMQKTPDGGISRFWYDRLGRLVISQNAYQLSLGGNVYSYTSYDSLGRITEVGQLSSSTPISDTKARSADSLTTWLAAAANSRTQFTQTVYDTAYLGFVAGTFNQANLRNRVSYSKVFRTTADALGVFGTYYSYDIHGNVNTLLQDFGPGAYNAMNGSNNRFKRIDYDYDLISGKVNQVSYQPGRPDAYYHRYAYDGENRLTDVYSGRDTIQLLLFPEREAHYGYYKHGPLARTDLGQLQVQGQDYVYTLQGWLKAVNPVMGGTLVSGTDTTEAFPVAQDVYGYSLHYFKRDYTAISDTTKTASVLSGLGANAAPLFNGNIAAMAVNLPKFGTPRVYNYKYDQLNRLVSMDAYTGLTPTTASFTPVSITDYKESVAYDPNGNIRTYLRNGDATRTAMDNLTYSYNSGTNQLNKVTDAAADATTNYSLYNDLKTGQANNNYQYDAIGNLISDASEGISKIDWTVYGKINYLVKGADTIRYAYDAAGNRIMKQTPTDTTFYVRDATGNVLSVYTKPSGGSLAQTELHLYGSSRLGMATQHLVGDVPVNYGLGYGTGQIRTFTRGEKLFELSNHLGNVLVTISDRRQQNSAGGTVVDSYAADVLNANDYYPFGMQMPGRKFAAGTSGYRYGFNGKENDNEVKGAGNQQDYGMRIYDPRIGKFLSVDPLTKSYPWYTPYQFAGNTPIQAIDLDGLEEWKVNGGKEAVRGPYANEKEAQKAVDEGRAVPYAPMTKKPTQEKKSLISETVDVLHTAWKVLTYDPLQPVAAQPEATSTLGQVAEMTVPYIPFERVLAPAVSKILPKATGPLVKSVGEYLGLMKPIDEFDVTKTLYRGTTGKETGATVLFLTDDAAVAASYTKNGGQVMQYEMSQFSLKSLQATTELELKTGVHGASGKVSTEYMFKGKELVEALNSIATPFKR